MTILCVSDHRDPIIYSSLVKERFGNVDVVLSAGDLELEYYGFIVSSLNKPLLFVFGNHNLSKIGKYRQQYTTPFEQMQLSDSYMAPSYGADYVGGKVKNVSGLIVAGLGGSRRYNAGANQFTEFQMARRMIRLLPRLLYNRVKYKRYLDILLTHSAPWGLGDQPDACHRGFKSFLLFMRWFKPAYLIHGHVHLYDLNANRIFHYEDTTIVNAYNHYVIEHDIPEKSSRAGQSVRI